MERSIPKSRYGIVIAVGASPLTTKRFEQSSFGYSIVNVFLNGDNVRALFDVHSKQRVFEYPGILEFEAVISHGVVGKVTSTSKAVPVKAAPQVSPYAHYKSHPAIAVNVKKLVYE